MLPLFVARNRLYPDGAHLPAESPPQVQQEQASLNLRNIRSASSFGAARVDIAHKKKALFLVGRGLSVSRAD
jgi:hypothetical protein